MAIYIKEHIGFTPLKVNEEKQELSIQESVAVAPQMISPNSLMVDIEGIHSILTINYNFYTEKCLRNSAPKWTKPYERPVIMHHKEQDGVIIGRVKHVEYKESDTRSGTPCQLFTCNIGDPKGIEGLKNGTLSTVSIGATVYDVRCSICGKNLAEEGECEHEKGVYYDGKLCYWRIEDMEPKEISYVIVPSDKYALTTKIYKPKNTTSEIKENTGEVNKRMSISEELLKSISIAESEEDKSIAEAAKPIDEDGKNAKETPKKDEEDNVAEIEKNIAKDDNGSQEKEQEKNPKDDEKPVDDSKDKEKNNEDDDKKPEADSNNENEGDEPDEKDEKIKELEAKIESLEKQIADLNNSLKKVNAAKESVDIELAKYKVREKVEVASKIKDIKESLGIKCIEAEDMAKNSSLKELELVYKNLHEMCEYVKPANKLPNKLLQESLVDNESDNISIKESSNKKSFDIDDFEELESLYNNLGL